MLRTQALCDYIKRFESLDAIFDECLEHVCDTYFVHAGNRRKTDPRFEGMHVKEYFYLPRFETFNVAIILTERLIRSQYRWDSWQNSALTYIDLFDFDNKEAHLFQRDETHINGEGIRYYKNPITPQNEAIARQIANYAHKPPQSGIIVPEPQY